MDLTLAVVAILAVNVGVFLAGCGLAVHRTIGSRRYEGCPLD
jgi:hypothetical protein